MIHILKTVEFKFTSVFLQNRFLQNPAILSKKIIKFRMKNLHFFECKKGTKMKASLQSVIDFNK